MATVSFDGSDLVVTLNASEQVMSLKRSFRVPRTQVRSLRWTDDLWRDVPPWRQRGLRVGTSVPGLALFGRLVHRDGSDFVCIGWRPAPGAVIEFTEAGPFRTALIQCPLLAAEPAPL